MYRDGLKVIGMLILAVSESLFGGFLVALGALLAAAVLYNILGN